MTYNFFLQKSHYFVEFLRFFMLSFTIAYKNIFLGPYETDLQNFNPQPHRQQIYVSFVDNSVFCAACKLNTKLN